MRILILSTSENGGAGIAAKRLYLELKAANEDVSMLTKSRLLDKIEIRRSQEVKVKFKDFLQKNFVRIQILLGLYHFGSLDFSLTKTFYDKIVVQEINDFDLINIHWVQSGFLSLAALKRIVREKPSVLTLHDEWFLLKSGHNSIPRKKFLWINIVRAFTTFPFGAIILRYKREILKNSKLIIVPSEWMKIQCINFGISSDQIFCIPNVSQFDPGSISQGLKKESSANGLPVTIGFVSHGRISHKLKNFKDLYLACSELRDLGVDIRILVAGARKTSSRTPEWVTFVVLGDREMGDFYRKLDFLVIPSVTENLPQVGIEAQIHGVFVLGRDSGGISETLASQDSGQLYSGGSHDLALKILEVINQRAYRFDKVLTSAQARNRWDPHTLAQKHLSAFRGVVNNA